MGIKLVRDPSAAPHLISLHLVCACVFIERTWLSVCKLRMMILVRTSFKNEALDTQNDDFVKDILHK